MKLFQKIVGVVAVLCLVLGVVRLWFTPAALADTTAPPSIVITETDPASPNPVGVNDQFGGTLEVNPTDSEGHKEDFPGDTEITWKPISVTKDGTKDDSLVSRIASDTGQTYQYTGSFTNSGVYEIQFQATVSNDSWSPKSVDAQYTVTVKVMKIASKTVATTPTDQTRTTIGVGEEVNLTLDPTVSGTPSWKITSGDGTLSSSSGATTKFTASDTKGTTVISANLGDGSVSISFNVIPPSGIQFMNPPLATEHTQGWYEAGFHAQVVILPTTVSFYNIEISELECVATATNYYSNWNGLIHPNWTDQGIGWLTPAKNNLLATTVDYVYSPRMGPPFGAGKFNWPIPWNYRQHGATNDGHNITTLNETFLADTNGNCTATKGGVSVAFSPGDKTVVMPPP